MNLASKTLIIALLLMAVFGGGVLRFHSDCLNSSSVAVKSHDCCSGQTDDVPCQQHTCCHVHFPNVINCSVDLSLACNLSLCATLVAKEELQPEPVVQDIDHPPQLA